jgi:DNA-binding transcriptional regulator YdaS (Cro superfamily)
MRTATSAVRGRFRDLVAHLGGTMSAAEKLGVSAPMVSLLVAGRRRPGLKLAVRIERTSVTWALGPIRPWEWCEPSSEEAA